MKVTIEVTHLQAKAIKHALDLYFRMCLGQFDELAWLVRVGEFQHARKNLPPDEMDEFSALTQKLKDFMGHDYASSFGVGSQRVSVDAHRCYEIYKVLSKAIAEAVNPNPNFRGVDYDGLIVRYTQDPAPVARVE